MYKIIEQLETATGITTQQSSENNNKDSPRGTSAVDGFRTRYGWYFVADCITGGNVFYEDELMEWSAIRFLNRVKYLKDKNEAEAFERSLK